MSRGARDKLVGAALLVDLFYTVCQISAVLAWKAFTCGASKGAALHAEANLYQLSREETVDEDWEALVQSTPLRPALVDQFRQPEIHINSKELLAFRSAFRHAARDRRLEKCRITFGIES
eukprot:3105240-Amphidinium_carterae.3